VSDIPFILSRLDFNSLIDILLVAMVFYWLLTLIQGTQAVQLLRGVLILAVLAAIAASAFTALSAFSWLIDKVLPALLVAIPVIFQPELRRALHRVGRTGGIFSTSGQGTQIEKSITAVTETATAMSLQKRGLLVVFERDTGLEDFIETGIRLDAMVTADLLGTIFFPGTPLHDGGVIIRAGRIVAANIVLPLGETSSADRQLLGTRHLAAIGITESTDAIAVIVSEETGLVSVAHSGRLIRGLDKIRLKQILRVFHKPQLEVTMPYWRQRGQTVLKRLRLLKSTKTN
jgi:diadenylate cyclase